MAFTIQIALQTDQNYVDGLVGCLVGVMVNLSRGFEIEAIVLDCGITRSTRQLLEKRLGDTFTNLRLVFVDVESKTLARFPADKGSPHLNLSAYARLLLPQLIPHCSRLIYLDCDLLVDADLSELAAISLNGLPIAAMRDSNIPKLRDQLIGLASDIEAIPPDKEAFNSGVMIMDLDAMRREDAMSAFTNLLAKGTPLYGDQSLLNAQFQGRWLKLSERWNRQLFLIPAFNVFRIAPESIWHIYMRHKPWHFHRSGARGLVADYYRNLDIVGWELSAKPTLQIKTSVLRDLLKSSTATLRRIHARLFGGSS